MLTPPISCSYLYLVVRPENRSLKPRPALFRQCQDAAGEAYTYSVALVLLTPILRRLLVEENKDPTMCLAYHAATKPVKRYWVYVDQILTHWDRPGVRQLHIRYSCPEQPSCTSGCLHKIIRNCIDRNLVSGQFPLNNLESTFTSTCPTCKTCAWSLLS